MLGSIARAVLLACVLASGCAAAEPIKLRLSFFTSDRTVAYLAAIKPFVDAVNDEGRDLLEIQVFFSGTLGRVQKELPQLLLDGGADIAFVVPGQNPERFRDNAVIELPGLFRDAREATLVHTRLAASGSLAGYEDFVVIGAYGTQPETIHSVKKLGSLVDLKGQRIRTNNATQAKGLEMLGARPMVLAFNETTAAISNGTLDGAAVPPAQLFDVGIGRLVTNHYMLATSTAPLTLLMSRPAFDRLPAAARALIQKYSGEWTAARFIEAYDKIDQTTFAQIKADERRKVIVPSPADLKTAGDVFSSIRRELTNSNPRNGALLKQIDTELAGLRSGSRAPN